MHRILCLQVVMSAPAPAVPAIVEAADVPIAKVQKYVDSLKTKITKLTEENARLKQRDSEKRSSNSRIRKIAKKPAAAAAAAPTEA